MNSFESDRRYIKSVRDAKAYPSRQLLRKNLMRIYQIKGSLENRILPFLLSIFFFFFYLSMGIFYDRMHSKGSIILGSIIYVYPPLFRSSALVLRERTLYLENPQEN